MIIYKDWSDYMISDVLPTIVIYLNRKFDIDIGKGIKAVKKSEVLKGCTEETSNDVSMQEWLGKFFKEVDIDIDTDLKTAKKKINDFINK
jgi:NRPS condensation-like uncharacterized protein